MEHRSNKISYALLGSGRLARHLKFYLQALKLPVVTWSRQEGTPLSGALEQATHVLLAVSDRAIPELAKQIGSMHKVVHFSGALNLPGVYCAHPLMTFGEQIQPLAWYKSIPFVIDEDADMADILPGLPNSHFRLRAEHRPLYHALCSLAGNSAYLLWQQIGTVFERQLGLPRFLLTPYLQQVASNAGAARELDFTGPVARGDWPTVQAHIESLNSSPELLSAYKEYLYQADSTGFKVPEALL